MYNHIYITICINKMLLNIAIHKHEFFFSLCMKNYVPVYIYVCFVYLRTNA